MNILITGGLGYLGTSLCELYENSEHRVIVADNRIGPRDDQWFGKGFIKYYRRDVFECSDLLSRADLVYHLAGVTDVPQTTAQSNSTIDSLISKVGSDGTREVLRCMPKGAKILFPSSHVVFEGYQEAEVDIKADHLPRPVLAYGKSKAQSEIDIQESGKNFVIFRLASLYGFNESIRWKILPNLFSKMAGENKNLKVFGGGLNIKPLTSVKDCARFLKFIAEGNCQREIFNVVNEHKTVLDVAKIAQKYSSSITVTQTNDEIPNLGHSLSNAKLLKTGFKFEDNLEEEMRKMVEISKC